MKKVTKTRKLKVALCAVCGFILCALTFLGVNSVKNGSIEEPLVGKTKEATSLNSEVKQSFDYCFNADVDLLNTFAVLSDSVLSQPEAIKLVSGDFAVNVGDNKNGNYIDQFCKCVSIVENQEFELNSENFIDGVITLNNVACKINYNGSIINTIAKFEFNYISSEDKGTIVDLVKIDPIYTDNAKYYFESMERAYGFWDGEINFSIAY